ncbi:MAG: Hpt domain-containing protein [Armatimonadetes bacterium]|nr:Hpt domain-containing protein [Armatimonadota bacterium]
MESPLDPEALGKIRQLGGDELLAKTLDIFLGEIPGQIERAREGAARGDAEAVRRAVHRVIPAAGMLGARELLQVARWVEQQSVETALDSLSPMVAEVEAEYRLVEVLIRREREALS